MKYTTGIIWFRNDLRLHDNPALTMAIDECKEVVPVYIFDQRTFTTNSWGIQRTGSFRAQFIFESLRNLNANLEKRGSRLLVYFGKPETIIAQLYSDYQARVIYAQNEVTTEEIAVEEKIKETTNLKLVWGSTLMHIDDLPLPITNIPRHFTPFRQKTENKVSIRKLLDTPSQIRSPKLPPFRLPDFKYLNINPPKTDSRDAFTFKGGEDEGMSRIQHYFFQTENISRYKETRNGLQGADYSSRFSPWLATGCLSPRMVYWQLKKFEQQKLRNESTYWLFFELLWRDYFKFVALQQGPKLFHKKGFTGHDTDYYFNTKVFNQWRYGQTKHPLINALMNEINATGYMGNRGRQIVASYLCKDLKQDWRAGAAWFEYLLIDYDAASNYGNWAYQAGVGNDPVKHRRFNIDLQTSKFDPKGEFISKWTSQIPEEKTK